MNLSMYKWENSPKTQRWRGENQVEASKKGAFTNLFGVVIKSVSTVYNEQEQHTQSTEGDYILKGQRRPPLKCLDKWWQERCRPGNKTYKTVAEEKLINSCSEYRYRELKSSPFTLISEKTSIYGSARQDTHFLIMFELCHELHTWCLSV